MENLIEYQTADLLAGVFNANTKKALQLLEELQSTLAELNKAFGTIGAQQAFGFSLQILDQSKPEDITREMKRRAWCVLIDKLGLRRLMSPKRIAEFDNALKKSERHRAEDPIDSFPEICPETIFEVLAGYAKSAEEFLDESILDVYEFLKPHRNDDYQTNKKNRWKLSRKVIIGWALNELWSDDPNNSFSITYSQSGNRIRALDSIFHHLDGKGFPASHYGPLHNAVAECTPANPRSETEYFKIRCCKNRNLHIEFKRLDLVDEFNFRCGNRDQLPGNQEDSFEGFGHADSYEANQPPLAPNGNLNHFETPEPLAAELVADAGIEEGDEVLEPSAGGGRIAKAIENAGGNAYCYEYDEARASQLSKRFDTQQANFLDVTPVAEFDYVVMNPPFSHKREIAHIRHAFKFLKDGGTLVSVASSSVRHRSEKAYVEFRQWLSNNDATIEDLPEESFSESGTKVSTVKVVIRKDSQGKVN